MTCVDYSRAGSASLERIEEALKRAEKKRLELPKIVQVQDSDWDVVVLADEIDRLQRRLYD